MFCAVTGTTSAGAAVEVCAQTVGCHTTRGIAEHEFRLAQAQRASLSGCGKNIDSLAENALRAVTIDAIEPEYFNFQRDGLAKVRALWHQQRPRTRELLHTHPGTRGLVNDSACLDGQAAAAAIGCCDLLTTSSGCMSPRMMIIVSSYGRAKATQSCNPAVASSHEVHKFQFYISVDNRSVFQCCGTHRACDEGSLSTAVLHRPISAAFFR